MVILDSPICTSTHLPVVFLNPFDGYCFSLEKEIWGEFQRLSLDFRSGLMMQISVELTIYVQVCTSRFCRMILSD